LFQGNQVDLNLDTLKREILGYLESAGMSVFRSTPGGLEGLPLVLWDSEKYPDYRMFLEVARGAGVKLIIFASAELEAEDLDSLTEQLGECELPRDERRDFESRIRKLRVHTGGTCTLELGFDLDGRLYVYEVQPDWYEEFLDLEEEITTNLGGDDEEFDGGDALGGYFSKN
jgi:hypothetical protein